MTLADRIRAVVGLSPGEDKKLFALADEVKTMNDSGTALLSAFEALKTANGGEDFTGWHDSFHDAIQQMRAAITTAKTIF